MSNEVHKDETLETKEILTLGQEVQGLENVLLLAKSGGLAKIKEVFENAKKD